MLDGRDGLGIGRGGSYDAVLIAGPTASGKSAFALEVAQATGGVIINADSMQMYADLAILTARPSAQDEAAAEHRLYGVVDGAENFSAARYADLAGREIAALQAAARLPIITGGTGLYFAALEDGLSDVPPIPAEIRERERAACEGVATDMLHARLGERSPQDAARLRPTDRLRIMRALEVKAATGRPLASFQGSKLPGPLKGQRLLKLFLAPERTWVHQRINERFVLMARRGALDEVKALAARRLDPLLPVMRAHGAPALMAHLRGEMSLNDAIQRGQADTRAYVKRQFTWFRHQAEGWRWLEGEADKQAVMDGIAARSATF